MNWLLDGGAEPDALVATRTADGAVGGHYTALVGAAVVGQLGAVRLLLDRGADPSLADSNGNTALMWAAANGHAGLVRELATRGADLDAAHPKHGGTAFHVACSGNQPECAALLVELGCDTAITAVNGMAGEQIAEEMGHVALLERLQEATERRRRAQAERASSQYSEYSEYAWEVGAPWVSWMAAMAATILATTGWSAAALAHSLCRCGARFGCCRWLARIRQRRAMYDATQAGDLAKMGQLLDGGAEPDAFVAARTADGAVFQDTALVAAARAGHLEAVRLLLDRGASPGLANSNGGTPLMAAAAGGHAGLERELATPGAERGARGGPRRRGTGDRRHGLPPRMLSKPAGVRGGPG
jgi:hypothetical protein